MSGFPSFYTMLTLDPTSNFFLDLPLGYKGVVGMEKDGNYMLTQWKSLTVLGYHFFLGGGYKYVKMLNM